jgi:hypothetical protein
MNNFLSKGLVMVAGLAGLPAIAVHANPTSAGESVSRNEDPRISSLRRFFLRNNSPAVEFADLFVREADHNGLDWRLLPGLAVVESGGGKRCTAHNLFGWMNGKAAFSSFAEAIQTVSWHLSNSRFYRHKSLDRMLLTYNNDPLYPTRVKQVMYMISPTVEVAMVRN